ncbi:MAG: hypothetical protein HW421_2611 [Ignavibacteria bacterium]|nr:hypothetical protein [Ignavibacteria bacterium]
MKQCGNNYVKFRKNNRKIITFFGNVAKIIYFNERSISNNEVLPFFSAMVKNYTIKKSILFPFEVFISLGKKQF